jgi:hypothetical protein
MAATPTLRDAAAAAAPPLVTLTVSKDHGHGPATPSLALHLGAPKFLFTFRLTTAHTTRVRVLCCEEPRDLVTGTHKQVMHISNLVTC